MVQQNVQNQTINVQTYPHQGQRQQYTKQEEPL